MANIRPNKEPVNIEYLPDQIQSLGAIQVFFFSYPKLGLRSELRGLSSLDGTRACLSKDYSKADRAQLLEHEMMHSIFRWGRNEPPIISLSRNEMLRIDGRMVEAGFFYEHQVYKKKVNNPSPFCLQLH